MKSRSVIRELTSNKLALFGIVILALAVFVSVAGAYLRPDDSLHANEQHIAIARKSPGFEAQFLRVKKKGGQVDREIGQGLFFGGIEHGHRLVLFDSLGQDQNEVQVFWKGDRLESIPYEAILDTAFDPNELNFEEFEGELSEYVSDRKFFLGTDSLGRDLLSRLMAGTIISLSVGLISVLISLMIGVLFGALAGYYRGWVDSVIMWMINVIWSIPTLLMVIAITLVMGKGFVQVFVAVGLTMWVEVARIVRGQFISLRTLPYIESGRSMGYSSLRLIFKHMLPNAMGPVIVISAANFASAILIEAGLSFLGIGTQIPMPSWGTMIKEHYAYITTDMAYLAILPGVCITLLVLALMMIGNGLRDALDVRSEIS